MASYYQIRKAFQIIFKLVAKIEVTGLENYPAEGPFIIAINHLTIIDPMIALAVAPPTKVTVFVAKKWESKPFVGWLVRGLDGIFVHRGEVDRHALQASLKVLNEGGALGIAPEGTRSDTGALIKAKPGVAYIAQKAHAPIIPVGISGQLGFVKTLLKLKRLRLRVSFGKAMYLPPLSGANKTAQLQAQADQVMVAIGKLIDPDLRGVYKSAIEQAEKS